MFPRRDDEGNPKVLGSRWLIVLLVIWLLLSLARGVFDLAGKLWIPAAFDLLQVLACILGLFALGQRRPALIMAFTVLTLISIFHDVALAAWYANLVDGWDRTQSLLSGGLPFGHSFFLRHTPFCSSHFNLTEARWEQGADCLVPYYVLELLQTSIHLVFAAIVFIFAIILFVSVKRLHGHTDTDREPTLATDSSDRSMRAKAKGSSDLTTSSIFVDGKTSSSSCQKNGKRGKLVEKSKRSSQANEKYGGVGTFEPPDSLNDLSSGYLNSSCESSSSSKGSPAKPTDERRFATEKGCHGHNESRGPSMRPVKSNLKSGPPFHGESYSSAGTVELKSTQAPISAYESAAYGGIPRYKSPPSAFTLANPPPLPPPVGKESHSYTAIIPKRQYCPPKLPTAGYQKISAAESRGDKGCEQIARSIEDSPTRMFVKNNISEAVARHRAESNVLHPNSGYLSPKQIAAERANAHFSPCSSPQKTRREVMTPVDDYAPRPESAGWEGKKANLTSLISFDPKSNTPLRVQEHVSSSEERSNEGSSSDNNAFHVQSIERRVPVQLQLSTSKESLPSVAAPVLEPYHALFERHASRAQNNAGIAARFSSRNRMGQESSRSGLERGQARISSLRHRVPYHEGRPTNSSFNRQSHSSLKGGTMAHSATRPQTETSREPPPINWDTVGISHPNQQYAEISAPPQKFIKGGSEKASTAGTALVGMPTPTFLSDQQHTGSVYECIGNQPRASTAFSIRRNEPERLVAGVSVAAAVSLSRGTGATADSPNEYQNEEPYYSGHRHASERLAPTHFNNVNHNDYSLASPYANYDPTRVKGSFSSSNRSRDGLISKNMISPNGLFV